MDFYINSEQAKTGVVAGMWTEEDIEKAKKHPKKHLKDNWYLNYAGVDGQKYNPV